MDITLILTYIQSNLITIIAALAILQGLTLVCLIITSLQLRRLARRVRALLGSKDGPGLEQMISMFLDESDKASKEQAEIFAQLADLQKELGQAVQRIGFIRYNAFPGVGGEMSFSIALLDGRGNGFVFTSIFGREEARVYAKEIRNGKPQAVLSEEEQRAVQQAMQQGMKIKGDDRPGRRLD